MSGLFGHVIAGAILLSATVLLAACASPVEGLWPPPPDSDSQTIVVSLDTWHAMIAFPIEPSATSPQLSATGKQWQSGASSPPGYQP